LGDPFLRKLLLEACPERATSGAVSAFKTWAPLGLTCSTCEMERPRAAWGLEIDTTVTQRASGMNSYEIMLSGIAGYACCSSRKKGHASRSMRDIREGCWNAKW